MTADKVMRSNATVEHKRQRALAMALAGSSYDEIAHDLGYANRAGAWKLVDALLKARTDVALNEYRTLELARLDRLQQAYWESALAGDQKAAHLVLKIVQARCKILGLDRLGGELEGPEAAFVVRPEHYLEDLKALAGSPGA